MRITTNKPQCDTLTDDCCEQPISEFEVIVKCTDPPTPVMVNVYNLEPCESLQVYRAHESCCHGSETTHDCGKKQVTIDCNNTETILTLPGRYKFRTASGDFIDEDVLWEVTDINIEFAKLRLQEQALCCCQQGK